jgi:hypothetical protein
MIRLETALLSDAEVSTTYFERLARLSRKLGDDGIALYSHRYDALSFGSWVVDAGTRHRRVRATYDGREGVLRFESAVVHSNASPIAWREGQSVAVVPTAALERATEEIVRCCRL